MENILVLRLSTYTKEGAENNKSNYNAGIVTTPSEAMTTRLFTYIYCALVGGP